MQINLWIKLGDDAKNWVICWAAKPTQMTQKLMAHLRGSWRKLGVLGYGLVFNKDLVKVTI
jgi:hypothetical protein